ncbi:MAG: IS110 family transposase [Candidatus Dormibacteraceae bacterium]
MAAPSIAEVRAHVTVGVDTRKHSHLGSAKGELGRTLGQLEIPTHPRGYADLLTWARSLGQVAAFGAEGTGSYGAGLTRFLRAQGVTVIEVLRPTRQDRRLRGQSDPAAAAAAAHTVLSHKALGCTANLYSQAGAVAGAARRREAANRSRQGAWGGVRRRYGRTFNRWSGFKSLRRHHFCVQVRLIGHQRPSADGLHLLRLIGNTPCHEGTSVAEQRHKAVLAVTADGRTVTDVARDFEWPPLGA